MSDPTLSLPFDQYQRYRLVTDILHNLRGRKKRLQILDVGGRTALLRQFLPQDQVFLVDVEESAEEGLVLGDGSRLPFGDQSVDAVVTFDTLEHVPPKRRAAFLRECRRVARRWVVVAGPYDTPGVVASELLLTEFLRDKLQVEHRYLAEHAAHGLPNLKRTEKALAVGGASVVSIGHANLRRWLTLMCAELYMDSHAPLRGLASKYYEFYNSSMYRSDHAEPVYRHAVVASIDGAKIPQADKILGPPVAPQGSFEPVAHVLQELLAFDVQRDVITDEWERLEKANKALREDLVGHQSSLSSLEELHQEQELAIVDLRKEANTFENRQQELHRTIDEQHAEVARLAQELDAQRAETERVEEEGATLAESLGAEIDAHVVLGKQHMGAIEGQGVEIVRLGEEIDREQKEGALVASQLQKRLDEHAAQAEEQTATIDEQTAEMGRLGSELERERAEGALVASQLQGRIADLEGQVHEHEVRGEQLQADVQTQAREAARAQAEALELTAQVQDREQQRALMQLHAEDLEQSLDLANRTLGEKQSALDTVRAELTHHRQLIEQLESRLRDRWESLLRAFGLK